MAAALHDQSSLGSNPLALDFLTGLDWKDPEVQETYGVAHQPKDPAKGYEVHQYYYFGVLGWCTASGPKKVLDKLKRGLVCTGS